MLGGKAYFGRVEEPLRFWLGPGRGGAAAGGGRAPVTAGSFGRHLALVHAALEFLVQLREELHHLLAAKGPRRLVLILAALGILIQLREELHCLVAKGTRRLVLILAILDVLVQQHEEANCLLVA